MDRPDREAQELLVAYREDDRMPTARKDAAWLRLQAALAAEDVPEDMSRTPDRRRPTAAWTIAALIAAAVVLLIARRGPLVGEHEPADSRQQALHGADQPALELVKPTQRGADATTTPAPAPAPTPAAGKPREAPSGLRAAAGDGSDLDAELALLRSARAALVELRAADALERLDEHARRFPAGHLVEERALLRVQALCETGARTQARAEAEAFARAQPGSPHAKKIVRVCPEGSTDFATAGKSPTTPDARAVGAP